MKTTQDVFRLALGAMLSLAAVTAASAQQAKTGTTPVTTFDTVTVTATRNETRVFDYPGSVTVIEQQEIEAAQPHSLGDIFYGVPGLDMDGGPRPAGEVPTIRGLGGDRVLIKVDGARRNFTAGHDGRIFIEPELLKQVDIVRGPASSIYGSGAIGGVLEFTTKDAADYLKPGERFGGIGKIGYQTAANMKVLGGTAFGRLGDDVDGIANLTFRESQDIRLGDGTSLENSAVRLKNGFAKIGWTPGDFHSFKLSGLRYNDDSDVPVNPQAAEAGTNPVAVREIVQNEVNLAYHYRDPANDLLDLKANIYRNELDLTENRRNVVQVEEVNFDTQGIDLQNTVRFNSSADIRHRLTFGGEAYKDTQDGSQNSAALGSRPEAEAMSYGLFVQDEVELFERLTLIPGLRFDSYKRESTGLQDTVEQRPSPKIAAGIKATDWLSFHGAYSHSFRAPSFIELYVSGQHFFGNNFVSNPDLKPEKAKTWEGGFGLQFKDLLAERDALRFKATYFDEEVKDFIELVVTATTSTNQNRAIVNRRGAEAELSYALAPFDVGLGYSFVRAEDATNGDSIDSTPSDKLALKLGYEIDEYDLRFRWTTLFSRAQNQADPANQTPGYAVHGMGVTWQPDEDLLQGVRVDLGVDNLLDKRYRRHNATLIEAGRNIKLTLSKRI